VTSSVLRLELLRSKPPERWLPQITAALAFAVLFWTPATMLLTDWVSHPDSAGLLLGPLALFLAYRAGLNTERRGRPIAGTLLLTGSLALRYLSGLAVEVFTMRLSMLGAVFALVVFAWGWKQLFAWWLPALLLVLSVPLPELVITSLALPLQYQASELGASMLAWRNVPVSLHGNVIELPGRSLFVTEACSGLRSLSSLIALGLLIGGLWLRTVPGRVLLLLVTVPVAIALNGVRIFLTGFLIYFVDPRLGEGIMHYTEGWILFVAALLIISAVAALVVRVERIVKAAS
jgi:exosortase